MPLVTSKANAARLLNAIPETTMCFGELHIDMLLARIRDRLLMMFAADCDVSGRTAIDGYPS